MTDETMTEAAAAELLRTYAPPGATQQQAWEQAVKATTGIRVSGRRAGKTAALEAARRVHEAGRVLGLTS